MIDLPGSSNNYGEKDNCKGNFGCHVSGVVGSRILPAHFTRRCSDGNEMTLPIFSYITSTISVFFVNEPIHNPGYVRASADFVKFAESRITVCYRLHFLNPF